MRPDGEMADVRSPSQCVNGFAFLARCICRAAGQYGFRLGEMMGVDGVADLPPVRKLVEIVVVDVCGLRR